MAKNDTVTKSDLNKSIDKAVDDITKVIGDFATEVSRQFDGVNTQLEEARSERKALRNDVRDILSRMDHIEKQIEIDSDERLVMEHQLQRLHDWSVEAGKRIGIDFKAH